MLRSNLSALNDGNRDHLFELLKSYGVIIVASFPSLNEIQTDSRSGDGVFQINIHALKKLNAIGYGKPESDLELNLVSTPTGAFLPPAQIEAEKRFRQVLKDKWEIVFNHLFNLARGLFMGGRKIHVSEMSGFPEANSHIATADHCYTCTAGAGFT